MRGPSLREIRLVLGWSVVSAVFASALGGCAQPAVRAQAAQQELPVVVSLAEIDRKPVTRVIHASGTLQAKREHVLSFKVGGVVAQVLVEEGQRVRQGQ